MAEKLVYSFETTDGGCYVTTRKATERVGRSVLLTTQQFEEFQQWVAAEERAPLREVLPDLSPAERENLQGKW